MQIAPNGKTVFDIRFELESTCLVEISVDIVFCRNVTSGTERTYSKSPYAVRTSDIKLFAIRNFFGISVCMFRTYKQAGRQPVFSTKTVIIFHFGTSLYELRKTAAKDMFLPMLSKKRCYPAKDISSRHSHELPDKAVIHFPAV